MEVNKCIGKLFHARDVAHLFHLKTNSYAAHKASNEFYDSILDLTDSLIESYQGKNGIISLMIPASYTETSTDLIAYLKELLTCLETECPFKDSDELNIIDEIKSLIKQTLYKLTYLK